MNPNTAKFGTCNSRQLDPQTYPVEERVGDVLVGHLPVEEGDVVDLEDAVVAVDEVGLVLAVDQHHVPRPVRLP